MIGNLKPLELLLIVALVALLFGAKKLPEHGPFARQSARILKSEARAMKTDDEAAAASQAPADAAPQAAPRTLPAAPGAVPDARGLAEPSHTVRS